jgi:acrylyl-CoA reductase (NADPH)
MFKGILLEKDGEAFSARVADIEEARLPEGTVGIRLEYSTLNYKDGLAITNRSPVVRSWPMMAGIDGAGVVEASTHPEIRPGERVVVNGWGLGETRWGCLAQRARLPGEWLVRLPESLSTLQAMAIGTAGYTAMLCAMALERHGVDKSKGEVLVTGASGGVGSMAVAILSGWGYTVVASTGKPGEAAWLRELGAADVIDRATLSAPGKPLARERWAGVVDSVGSHTLANACAATRYGGVVAACGLAQGMDFPGSVAPFILRGVTLAGIDSVMAPMPLRLQAWDRLARDLDRAKLERISEVVTLADAIPAAARLMSGSVRGRLVVDVNA